MFRCNSFSSLNEKRALHVLKKIRSGTGVGALSEAAVLCYPSTTSTTCILEAANTTLLRVSTGQTNSYPWGFLFTYQKMDKGTNFQPLKHI
jgi:hypothetical protein